jgi:hypothetical protein
MAGTIARTLAQVRPPAPSRSALAHQVLLRTLLADPAGSPPNPSRRLQLVVHPIDTIKTRLQARPLTGEPAPPPAHPGRVR